MLSTILVGGTLVLLRAFSPREALALIEAERITHGAFVPVQLERLLGYPERRAFRTDSLETLDVLRFAARAGGEARLCANSTAS
jgi:acyl-CoA synthetase (AMP-forming)/AMP-acid ligase II